MVLPVSCTAGKTPTETFSVPTLHVQVTAEPSMTSHVSPGPTVVVTITGYTSAKWTVKRPHGVMAAHRAGCPSWS